MFSTEDTSLILTSGILFYGLAAGTVEEMVFRGLIMGILERRFGIKAAVIAPSVLFGALHIIGRDMDFVSTVQFLIAEQMMQSAPVLQPQPFDILDSGKDHIAAAFHNSREFIYRVVNQMLHLFV